MIVIDIQNNSFYEKTENIEKKVDTCVSCHKDMHTLMKNQLQYIRIKKQLKVTDTFKGLQF